MAVSNPEMESKREDLLINMFEQEKKLAGMGLL